MTNEATNKARTVTTDDNGSYTVTNLLPGSYSVAVEQTGFKKIVQTGNILAADGRLTVDAALEVGGVTETVEVVAEAGETVNTTSGEVSRVIDSQQVEDLALNTRNFINLTQPIPGAAVLDDNQLGVTSSLTIGETQSINGNRHNANSVNVDGVNNLNSGNNNSVTNNVGIDFIQEVKIQTSNFSAEYGRNSGANVNVVTKSGGNNFTAAFSSSFAATRWMRATFSRLGAANCALTISVIR